MKATFAKRALPASGALAVLVYAEAKLSKAAEEVDAAMGKQLSRALRQGRFRAAVGEIVEVPAPSGLKASRVLAVGAGDPTKLNARAGETIGAGVVKRLRLSGEVGLSVMLDPLPKKAVDDDAFAAAIAHGADLASYAFEKYFTKKEQHQKPSLTKISVLTDAATAAKKAFASLEAVGEGVALARDLMMEPANILTPGEFAKRCKALEKLDAK